MSFDTYLRIFVALCGLFIAGAFARALVTGRISHFTGKVSRSDDAPTYWKAVGINALLVLTITLVIWVPGRLMTPVFFAGLLISQILSAYLTGEVPWYGGRVFSRAKGDPGFRRMIIFYWAVLALFIFLLVARLFLDRPGS